MKKAIVIGASSGIGKELSKILSVEGYTVGLASRRLGLLREQENSLMGKIFIKQIDITDAKESMNALDELIQEMGHVDLIVISSGVGNINESLDWELENESIVTNVSGFSAMANVAIRHFYNQGSGHLVGISSIAALRGGKNSPAYNASKAYVSNYLEGLRQKVAPFGGSIVVTEIRPGFVDTAMAKGDGLFWVSPVEKAAKQIYLAIVAKKSCVYVTRRWQMIGWLLKLLPNSIYSQL